MSLRERLDTLSRGELGGLAVLLVVTLAGAGLWYSRSLPRPVQISTSASAVAVPLGGSPSPEATVSPTVGSPVPGATPSPSEAAVVVDVAGHVRRPGVYRFASGARVIDAIRRAGGASHGAALVALNLAALLVDGSQIYVPAAGETAPVGAAPGAPVSPGAPAALVNVNTADATAFEALPEIGEVLAAEIVQYRTQHGPFSSVDQLEDVSGIGPSTMEKLRPLVTV